MPHSLPKVIHWSTNTRHAQNADCHFVSRGLINCPAEKLLTSSTFCRNWSPLIDTPLCLSLVISTNASPGESRSGALSSIEKLCHKLLSALSSDFFTQSFFHLLTSRKYCNRG
ncbi:hypothetical protein AVEN_74192-1 [Araneus ventricosus]|uniref:Uncharacterized protein n=1 Tax=Araneus ventricosus TaxID=182803 RepID=A0A4Y2IBL5_ARAVE|nr:hypothetical protein AVEN_74192-1 [Araneus ventricosus]